MHLTSFFAFALLSLLRGASASIYNITFPATVEVHKQFNVTLLTEGNIQTSQDVVVVFGLQPGSGLEGSLGYYKLTTHSLGPAVSNVEYPIVFKAILPPNFPSTNAKYPVTATVFSLLGTYNTPSFATFSDTVSTTGY
ncbi:uncharacterized protein LY89DRAFT_764533 [Mollisia scopiformis]|uniref:Secreted protein n=1 Tax=Mollisia scopiformis TaxID=149040 RepID=A0A132B846_MOLSC|nr:uncharacterized protein LY89DRAFT_764533 [Mollisia scopiformis]KUJ08423.1 hypothetical protein LY89DRAFT_764533 [Mollisia scopiformis]